MKKKNKKIKRFEKLLRKDEDWDFEYLIELEYQKLKFMLKYFETHNYVDTTFIVRDIRLCLKLIDIIAERDPVANNYYSTWNIDKEPIAYINRKNAFRFVYGFNPTYDTMSEVAKRMSLFSLRVQKAWNLYNLIRMYRMQTWWD